MTLSDTPREVVVRTEALSLDGARGPVYSDIDLELAAGEVAALIGPAGSGRTALLLTIAARMAPTRGSLTVLGHALPRGRRDVQHHAAIAHVSGIDDLDDGLTVGELFEERAGLSVPLWRRPLRRCDRQAARLTDLAYGVGAAPEWDTLTYQLTPLQRLQTSLLLALVGSPRLVVVDDVDTVRDPGQQRLAWACLQRAAETGIAVVGAATSADAIPAAIHLIHLAGPPAPTPEPTPQPVPTSAPEPAAPADQVEEA